MARARAGGKRTPAKGARPPRPARPRRELDPDWTFLTNHAHVLICIARDPAARMRDVAELVGITERAVQRIIADLEQGGYIERTREGRRNRYTVRADLPLRHPVEWHAQVSTLLDLVLGKEQRRRRR